MKTRLLPRAQLLATAGLAVLLAAGCLPDRSTPEPVDPDTPASRTAAADAAGPWTVLVYMAADNNLEPAALEDLEEMTEAEGTQFLVLVDRSPEYSAASVLGLGNFTDTRLLRIADGTVTTLESPGELNMGDPAVLAEFVATGLKESPTGHHALVVWDHGGSWNGAAWDDSSGEDRLELREISSGIRDGLGRAGVERFDLLGFDACLMAGYEVASPLRDYGTYLLASEEVEPGFGWDWTSFGLPAAGLGTPALAEQVIAGFEARALRDKELSTTLSLVDLTQLDRLDAAVGELATAIGSDGRELVGRVGWSRGASISFGRSPNPAQDYFMVDLGDLARQLGEVAGLRDRATKLGEAVDAVVVNQRNGPVASAASGIAGYFPPARAQLKKAWSGVEAPRGWQQLLDAFYDAAARVPVADLPTFADPDRYIDESGVDEGTDGIALRTSVEPGTGGNIAEARLFWGEVDLEDTNRVTFFGRRNARVDRDEVSATYGWEYLRISDGTTTMPAFADLTVDRDGKVTRIVVPIVYRRGAKSGQGSLELTVQDGSVVAESYYLETGSGGIAALTPEAGDSFSPLLLEHDMGAKTLQWKPVGGRLAADPAGLQYRYSQLPGATAVMFGLTIADVAGSSDFAYYGTATPAELG